MKLSRKTLWIVSSNALSDSTVSSVSPSSSFVLMA